MKARSKRLVSQLRMLWRLKWWDLRQRIDLRRRVGIVVAWVQDYLAQTIIAFVGGALVIAFVGVMFADDTAGIVGKWFGTIGKKTETLQFLGWIISGFIGVFGLVVFNRRAAAQDENNRLIEKGLSQERFKTAVDHLSDKESEMARIASFYEFFYLAKDNKDDYAQTVLDILCVHLRRINSYNPAEESAEKANALEVKILIDILFGSQTEIFFVRQTAYIFDELRFDLQGVDLRRAVFPIEANLRGAHFMGANLESAKFRNANLKGANFMGANLSVANLEGANLERANFTDANLKGANLGGANLQGADLVRANLERAKLPKANLEGANLIRANLTAVDLGEANLQKAYLTNANLEGADLRKAHLQNANLENANLHITSLQEARLWHANLCGANLMRAELCEASLENADLQNTNFVGADLKETLFAGADLSGADLSCADNFDYAIIFNVIVDEETKYPPGFKKPEE